MSGSALISSMVLSGGLRYLRFLRLLLRNQHKPEDARNFMHRLVKQVVSRFFAIS